MNNGSGRKQDLADIERLEGGAMNGIDMSPDAVTNLLQRVDELRELCRILAGPRLKYPRGVELPKGVVRDHPDESVKQTLGSQ